MFQIIIQLCIPFLRHVNFKEKFCKTLSIYIFFSIRIVAFSIYCECFNVKKKKKMKITNANMEN